MTQIENNLTKHLIDWFSREKRQLPWRENKDPYRVWLSEIILQQTRVAQGTPYFHAFVDAYPTVFDFANANEQQVLKLWEGLGYYSRARNMLKAARQIVNDYNGEFPNSYDELLKLKGVGPYTAAAIASICFNIAVPVIDGNVYRLISRLYGIADDIAIPRSRKVFETVLEQLIPKDFPGDFNQAMMEHGALVCLPKQPACTTCVLAEFCYAQLNSKQSNFPVKMNKVKVSERIFHYLVITHADKVYMKLRESGDIWEGLWDFMLIEGQSFERSVEDFPELESQLSDPVGPLKHILTHQRIFAWFHQVTIDSPEQMSLLMNKFHLIPYSLDELVTLPKPKLIVNYLTQVNI